MLQRLRNVLKSSATACTSRLRRIASWPERTTLRFLEWVVEGDEKYIKDELLNDKVREITLSAINILTTGALAWIALGFRSNPLSLGLLLFLGQYYIGWLIDRIKQK